ncbi:hypothetical protein GCM10023238_04110 [Streptomyces heliomycini]
MLGAAERIDPRVLGDIVMIGELGLDGRVRPVRGILPAVLAAADAGYEQVVVPECAAAEASLVPGVSVLGIRSLRQLIALLTDEPVPEEDAEEQMRPDPLLAGLRAPAPERTPGCTASARHRRTRAMTSRTSWASSRRGRPWRWPRPADTTSSWKDRRVPARPCWRSGCRRSCRRWTGRPRSR